MKRKNLRKIIKESINELINEQQVGGEIVRVRNCYNQNYSGGNQIGFGNVDFACVPVGTQLGDKITLSQSSFFNAVGPGDAYVVDAGPQIIHPVTGNNSCLNPQSVTPLSGPCYTCCQYEDGTNALPQPGSSFGCCPSQPPQPLPTFGCTAMTAANFNPNADGCEVSPGIADSNDYSCCTAPPNGQVNFGTIKPMDTKTPFEKPKGPSDDMFTKRRNRTKLNELSSSNLSSAFSHLATEKPWGKSVDNNARADLIGLALPAIEQTSINSPQIAKLVSNLLILKDKYDTKDGMVLQQQPELVQMAVDYLSDKEALAAFSTITDIEEAMAAALKAGADTLGGSTEKIYTASAFPDGMRDSDFYKNAVEDGYKFILKPYLNGRSAQALPVGKDGFMPKVDSEKMVDPDLGYAMRHGMQNTMEENKSILRMKKLANII